MATPEDCLVQGGNPQGAGTDCDCGPISCCPIPYLWGACCFPDISQFPSPILCEVLSAPCCEALPGGTLVGPWTECTAPEACCLPDGTCEMVDPLCCDAEGGVPQGAGSVCLGDDDGDGLIDECDACPDSDLSDMIVIDGCDTEVANMMPGDDGCTMADLIAECAESATTHGAFVSCVAHLTNEWKRDGLISGHDKSRIQRCAAQADVPSSPTDTAALLAQ